MISPRCSTKTEKNLNTQPIANNHTNSVNHDHVIAHIGVTSISESRSPSTSDLLQRAIPIQIHQDRSRIDSHRQMVRLSINTRLINKNLTDRQWLAQGFRPAEISIDQLIEHICRGHAYSYRYTDDRRQTKYFDSTDILSVDVDEGMTIDEALADPLIARIASFIYTTVNHTEEANRFRIVCQLEETISSSEYLCSVVSALTQRLNGDIRTVGAAQLFCGNTEAVVHRVGGILRASDIDDILSDASKKTDNPSGEAASTGRSAQRISPSQSITGANGKIGTIFDHAVQATIYCPFHDDKKPSARIYEKESGARFIRCFSCNKSYWVDRNAGAFDFHSFENTLRGKKSYGASEILHLDRPFVDHLTLVRPGVNFIRSPKGTGKTNFLSNAIPADASVLLIGHRKALLRNLSARLGLDCYLDVRGKSAPKRFAVCLDSLPKYTFSREYQYIIFDESEQVLSHLVGETMKGKEYNCINKIQSLVRPRTATIIALDADLGWLSYNTLTHWSSHEGTRDSRIFLNEYRKERGAIEVFSSKLHISSDIKRAVLSGQKCYVASNAKSYIDELAEALSSASPAARILQITSDTARIKNNPAGQFIQDPIGEARKYDVVLASPTVGTGVDISFPEQESYFETLYGVFEPGITTHFECDQQLSRVRHPKEVKVFVSPRRQMLEADVEVVEADLNRRGVFGYANFADEDSVRQIEERSGLLALAVEVEAMRRASLNNLQGNFLDYKQDEGWEIIYVPKDPAFVGDGKKLLHKGKTASITARIEALMKAQKLSGTGVASLLQRERTRSGLTQEEHDALARAAFVAFYRKQPTREALRFELEMRPREKILTFCEMMDLSKASSLTQCLSEKGVHGTFASKHKQARLLRGIFFTTPVYDGLSFDAEVQYCKDDLDLFVEYVSGNKDQIEEELGVKIRKDLFKMPTRQLAVFLEMVNLDHYQSCCKVRNKKKLYYYKIDAKRILMNIAVRDRRQRVTCDFHELELRRI